MSAAKHMPGPVAGLEIALRIGQHVRHRDFNGKRVTGIVRALTYDSDNGLRADIALDEPIIIPARDSDDRELRIYTQYVPAHELAPFDEREELIGEMLEALQFLLSGIEGNCIADNDVTRARAAIAKATGSGA